ncbi:GntR family transcriptional regulator [Aeromicrobium fastidiosum]|uniref:GntR family transcriptional regulator n=1 Tax=Aeromicrobium fastidiosum TaxID=52699 RepID=UPI0020231CB7|nr:GntR family transcriptional regulator [Aeromicrobium fastidiosum]MCL8249987.1 GntR family transcriptional regulator [Aeromicrobium fastidiosum]
MSSQPATQVRPDAVVAHLRGSILSRELAPGTAVTEAHVASRFDVARPTARIAIDRLVADGLLVREPHHAARVRTLDRDDIDDLFISRAAIEAAAVELLATTTTVPTPAAEAHRRLLDQPDDAPYTTHDLAFHRALVHGTTSTRLPRLHDLLMGEIELGISQVEAHRLRSGDEVVGEHQAILDAIAEGDVDRAGRLTRAHILASRDQLVAHYDSTHTPPTAQKVT